jgi:hypothetical protein
MRLSGALPRKHACDRPLRRFLHPNLRLALGAEVYQVAPGYISVVQARAAAYAAAAGASLVPFGGPDTPAAVEAIAQAALAIGDEPDEVWCAAGSGVLARGLALAWPKAKRHVVQVGRTLSPEDVADATIHVYPRPFGAAARSSPPFPSDPHYDAKAWETATARR